MEEENEHRFSIDEIHLEDTEEEKNIFSYINMFMNSLPRMHPQHPNPVMRPPNRISLSGSAPIRPVNQVIKDMSIQRQNKKPPAPILNQNSTITDTPEVKKIAVINSNFAKPRPPSLFMQKVNY